MYVSNKLEKAFGVSQCMLSTARTEHPIQTSIICDRQRLRASSDGTLSRALPPLRLVHDCGDVLGLVAVRGAHDQGVGVLRSDCVVVME